MPYASHRFIDPRTLAAIADLHLAARAVVDGFMFGSHESRLAGAGLEFSQYRSYEPGDDLRRIDWRLYARSDRYYVREADAEMSLTVRFLLDTSESMMHEEDGPRIMTSGATARMCSTVFWRAWRPGMPWAS